MTNFLRGIASIFNLFPQTDYMAIVPKKGEIHRRATQRFSRDFNKAFNQQVELADGRTYLKKYRKGVSAQ
ncbi:hypothetical protein FJM67_16220 [Maribrevibacterium harenarium]|uniref:Uncharacterized protein n=1 Tax=Maribrevibacterium harenarium TaxID=2589817 RepID=A0A501W762_9GAMM|nr:hypothetical protein [Maribrevibacterium harenarium]TPE45763.1 hypothetical protein FJM67_16220 [Maribrevibacterium harenarium]